MRVLTFSTLFPNARMPQHGIFVETRLRKLAATGAVEPVVVAPVPWFPLSWKVFGQYADWAAVPFEEERHGIRVLHPRYPVLPRIGMYATPSLMAAACRGAVRRIVEAESIDLVDAHYFYPDGVAAARLAAELDLPLAITARGTDVNLLPEYPRARRMIMDAAGTAAACITVSDALNARLVELGVAPGKVVTLRNGVDTHLFRPVDRDAVRGRLGLSGNVAVTVGNVIPTKGQRIVMEALRDLPGVTLLIVGDGADVKPLKALSAEWQVGDRVRFVGRVAQKELKDYYGAADVSVLASAREGWPNVLLESMACGTPATATDVGGIAEIIRAPEAGRMIAERTPEAVAAALRALFADPPDRAATRRYAEGFGWDATTQGQLALFRSILAAA